MPAQVTLTILQGDHQDKSFTFDSRETFLIGRDSNCHLRLTDQAVSRHHCLLDINPPYIKARDLGSKFGTFVNGEKIGQRPANATPAEAAKLQLPEYELKAGDRITIHQTILEVGIITLSSPETTPVIATDPDTPHTIRFPQQNQAAPAPTPPLDLFTRVKAILKRAMGSKEKSLLPISGYSVERKLGSGAFGEVYLAKHARTGEQVALKVMLPEVATNPLSRDKFLRELENTKALKHPNIVSLRDYGFSDEIFFFTLEYCEAGTLETWMKQRTKPMPPSEAIPLIMQVLDGLNYAHRATIPYVKLRQGGFGQGQGLVHRDLKPSNLLLTQPKQNLLIKIADFGVSKAFDQAGLSGFSMSGRDLEGTLHFMPRSQILSFKHAQPDVDVWATVACLYYMLTGGQYVRDFRGRDPLLTVLQTNPIPIRQLNANIPKPLATLIDAALIDHPDLPFKTAAEFKRELLKFC